MSNFTTSIGRRATFEMSISRRAIFIRMGRFELDAGLATQPRAAGQPLVWREVNRTDKAAHGRIGLIEWCASWGIAGKVL